MIRQRTFASARIRKKYTAQARVFLIPKEFNILADWGFRQGLIQGAAALRAKPIADDPPTGPPSPVDITKQRVDIEFGTVKTQCKPSGEDILCDFDIPVTRLDYRFAVKGNLSYFKPELAGVQLLLQTNGDHSKDGHVHFQGKITQQGGPDNWLQIVDGSAKATIAPGSYQVNRDPSLPPLTASESERMRARVILALGAAGAGYEAGGIGAGLGAGVDGGGAPDTPAVTPLVNAGYAFFSSKLGRYALNHYILPQVVMPEIVDSLKPFLKGGIPLIQSDLALQPFDLPRAQDGVDSDGLAETVARLKSASAKIRSAASAKDLKVAAGAYTQQYNGFLHATQVIKTADIVDPQFEATKTDLDATISQLKSGPFSNSAEVSKLQSMSKDLDSAKAAFDKNAEHDTLALWATKLEIPTPGSIALAMGACPYCNELAIVASPLKAFPKIDPTKDRWPFRSPRIRSIRFWLRTSKSMEWIFVWSRALTFESCAFTPPGAKTDKIVMKSPPTIQWDPGFNNGKGGFYIQTGQIVPTNVANGVFDGIENVKFYLRVEPSKDPKEPSKDGSQLNFSVYDPVVEVKTQNNSLRTKYANYLAQHVGTVTLSLVEDWLRSLQKVYGRQAPLFSVPDNAVTFTGTDRSAAGFTIYGNPHLPDIKPDDATPAAGVKP